MNTPTPSIGFGWLPDVPSVKDYTAETPAVASLVQRTKSAKLIATTTTSSHSAAAAAPALLPAVDLRQSCSPIENQGPLGSCTANAAAGLVEYFEHRAFNK